MTTKDKRRKAAWYWIQSNVPEGSVLPWWAIAARAILFPLDFFYWRMSMSRSRGYQWQNDTWQIDGVTYSGRALLTLAKAQGEIYRITRTGETVTINLIEIDTN